MQELSLEIGEAKEVVIHASPPALGSATATLVCEVAGNPGKLELALACTGALPLMELHILAEDAALTGKDIYYMRAPLHSIGLSAMTIDW